MSDPSHLAVAVICFATGLFSSAIYNHFRSRNQSADQGGRRTSKDIGQAGFSSRAISSKLLREALRQVKHEELPKTPEYKEAYFVTQVSVGELLATQGPEFHLSAAIAFFKALRIYPLPVDLVMIYQNHVPEPIFKLVMDLMYLDGRPPSIPNTQLISWSQFHRWNRGHRHAPHHPAMQPRFSFSLHPPFTRVRAVRRTDIPEHQSSIAISPNQQILHRALRNSQRRISFA